MLDLRVLASLRQLDPGQDRQLMARVLLTYRESLARQLDQASRARSRQDLAALRMAAHTLKSASAIVGARGLAQLCASVEALAREGDAAGLAAPLDRLAEEARRVDAAVQQVLAGPTP